jgi:hypothetical protein
MTITALNNGAPLLEQRTKINDNFAELDRRVTAAAEAAAVIPTPAQVGAATAAQGARADSAVQPGALGSAAAHATSDFATAAQGLKADSALQASNIVNNLTAGGAALPLSAEQGKALKTQVDAKLAFVGTFANLAALQAGFPAAANPGAHALIGAAAPYLVYESNGVAWLDGGENWQVVTASGAAAMLSHLSVDSSAGPISMALPAAGRVTMRDHAGTWGTNPVTVTAPAGTTIDGASTFLLNEPGYEVEFELVGAAWRYKIQYLYGV